jgi:hypothetical protein
MPSEDRVLRLDNLTVQAIFLEETQNHQFALISVKGFRRSGQQLIASL